MIAASPANGINAPTREPVRLHSDRESNKCATNNAESLNGMNDMNGTDNADKINSLKIM